MPKLLTRLLLLTLSAFSFTVFSDFNENPVASHVAPETKSMPTFYYGTTQYPETKDHCPFHIAGGPTGGSCNLSFTSKFIKDDFDGTSSQTNVTCEVTCKSNTSGIPGDDRTNTTTYKTLLTVKFVTSSFCPPVAHPKYVQGPFPVDPLNADSTKVCFPRFKPCPLGYFAHAVTPSSGVEQCVPVSCPSKGSSVNNIKNFQNVLPVSGAGTFCDGLCSYSVEQGAISYQGQKFASGISNGAVCGQSPTDKNKFTSLEDDDSCQEHTLTSGAIFQDCSDGVDEPVDEQPDPTPTVEDALVDEDVVVDPFTGIDCKVVEDKMSCVGENITDAITEQTKKQAKLDAEKHNKLVNQQKEISDYVENQANKRFEKQTDIGLMTIQSIDNVARTIGLLGQGAGGDGTGNQAILDALGGIGDGLGDTDTETDAIPSDGIESFYESEYPNGFADVWSKNKALLYSSAPFEFVNQFSNIPTTGGTAPDMEFCFNLGENMNYGCDSITLDSRIFGFLYSIMMISAAFACRQIIFGG
jgi:hypothetical protein